LEDLISSPSRTSSLEPNFADDLLTFSPEVRSSGFSDFRVFLSVFSRHGFVEKGVLVVRTNRRRLTSRQQAQHGLAKPLQTQRELDAGRANGYPLAEGNFGYLTVGQRLLELTVGNGL